MIFTSLTFLGFFALLLCLLPWFKGHMQRIYLLLAASYVFYGAWDVRFLSLILASSLWAWWLGLLMDRSQDCFHRKFYLTLSLILSLSMLGYFKYADFFLENFADLFGLKNLGSLEIILPVGISFFTFQTMSYTIDLYRRRIPVCSSLPKFMLFVAFFPQLVAGPIVRASHFLPQLEKPIFLTRHNAMIGAQIFLGGAAQKVLIADNLARFVDPTFANPALYSWETLWLAVVCYAIQIFCDFSGYSLMAIGIARILGFDIPRNFNMPYIATSVTEFWHRWHMSLSTWLRDYLYIPLGGSQQGRVRTRINLMITMLLGGLWHGASWNFVIWGGLHGGGLITHKLWEHATAKWFAAFRKTRLYLGISWLATMAFVGCLWIPFRCQDFATTFLFLQRIMPGTDGISWLHSPSVLIVACVAVWHLLHAAEAPILGRFPTSRPFEPLPATVILAALLLIVMFAPVETSPFIYFQF